MIGLSLPRGVEVLERFRGSEELRRYGFGELKPMQSIMCEHSSVLIGSIRFIFFLEFV
jgi:hypothetical protein